MTFIRARALKDVKRVYRSFNQIARARGERIEFIPPSHPYPSIDDDSVLVATAMRARRRSLRVMGVALRIQTQHIYARDYGSRVSCAPSRETSHRGRWKTRKPRDDAIFAQMHSHRNVLAHIGSARVWLNDDISVV